MMSYVALIDRWLQRTAPAEICVAAFAISAIILFIALPLGVADYTVPLSGKDGTLDKQVGIWSGGINWVVIFLVTYPAFLFVLVKMAGTIRYIISDLNRSGMVESQGSVTGDLTAECQRRLDVFLAERRLTIIVIAAGTLFVTLLLWIGAAGRDIITCSTEDRLIFWANGIVLADKCAHGSLVLAYSVLVYAWLGVIVFSYIASLFFCILYASFLGKLFSGHPTTGNPEARVVINPGEMNLAILRPLTFEISMICTLGLVTIFFMNLQLAYLTSDAKNISEFLTQYLSPINRLLSRFFPIQLTHTHEGVLPLATTLSPCRLSCFLLLPWWRSWPRFTAFGSGCVSPIWLTAPHQPESRRCPSSLWASGRA